MGSRVHPYFWALLWVIAGVQSPRQSRAQSAVPIPLRLAMSPDGELAAILVSDRGLLIPDDAGRWRMMCNAALGLSVNGVVQEWAWPSQELLLATYNGLLLTDPSGCHATPHDGGGLPEYDVLTVDQVGTALYALSSLGGDHTLLVSHDLGATFSPLLNLDLDDRALLQLLVAPSQPERIYFLGVDVSQDAGVSTPLLLRSEDGGVSLTQFELPAEGDRELQLLAVDPRDPDRLYAAAAHRLFSHTHGDEHLAEEPDVLLGSQDGGETFQVLREVSTFGGFALGSEPGELWLGDSSGQLLHSTDYGAQFSVVHDALHPSCLKRVGERLWACADSTADPFSVGSSDDGGETFKPVMRFDEVAGALLCDGQPQAACRRAVQDFQFWHPPTEAPSPRAQDPSTIADAGAEQATDAPTGDSAKTQADVETTEGGKDRRDAGLALEPSTGAGEADGCGCSTLGAGPDRGLRALPLWLIAFALWLRKRGSGRTRDATWTKRVARTQADA